MAEESASASCDPEFACYRAWLGGGEAGGSDAEDEEIEADYGAAEEERIDDDLARWRASQNRNANKERTQIQPPGKEEAEEAMPRRKKVSPQDTPLTKRKKVEEVYKGSDFDGTVQEDKLDLDVGTLKNEIDTLKAELNELRTYVKDVDRNRAINRQAIIKLGKKIDFKTLSGEQRDYNMLSRDLLDHVRTRIATSNTNAKTRAASMTYRDVMLYLHLNHKMQAYRLMERVALLYPDEVYIHNGGKGKKMLSPTGQFIRDVLDGVDLL